MHKAVISGTGLYTPANSISNDELVASFNAYVKQFNADNAAAIERGEVEALSESSSAFIEKASGIKSRFVIDKAGILDPAKVTRSALQNAASIAALFLTTEAVIADKPEKAPAMPAGGDDMGGMGF